MNKVILIGRLTKDPEVRYTQVNNTMVVIYSLAVNRRFKQEGQPEADFFNIIAWGKVGEFASKYFKKGQQVGVVGRLQTRKYEDKDGKTVYVTEIIAEEQYFADGKRDNTPTKVESAPTDSQDFTPVTDDDLPF